MCSGKLMALLSARKKSDREDQRVGGPASSSGSMGIRNCREFLHKRGTNNSKY